MCEVDADVDLDAVAGGAFGERLDRGLRAELVQRRGTQVGDQRAEVGDALLELLDRLAVGVPQRLGALRARRRGEPDAQRREALEGLVVQLARPPLALPLGRGQALALALGGDRLRGRDRGGGARRKRLQQPFVLGGEAGPVLEAVEREQRAVAATLEEQRDHQPALGVDSQRAGAVLVEAGAVELVVQAQRAPCAQRLARDRVLHRDSLADQLRGAALPRRRRQVAPRDRTARSAARAR